MSVHTQKNFLPKLFLHSWVVIFSTWARFGFADNLIHLKNNLFMHRPTWISELSHTNQIQTSEKTFSRQDLENGEIPIEIFGHPRYAPQALDRMSQIEIETQQEQGTPLTQDQKLEIKKNIYETYANQTDPQVIEGIALGLSELPPQKIYELFKNLSTFERYIPTVFLKSHHLTQQELKLRHVVKPQNIEFQYSRVRIAHVEFTHTIRYETTRGKFKDTDHDTYTVAWEIDPRFQDDAEFQQNGVIMNNGYFLIQPYVMENGKIDPHRSLILYHIYIKPDPLNIVMETLKKFFKESEAKSALYALADALRKQTHK